MGDGLAAARARAGRVSSGLVQRAVERGSSPQLPVHAASVIRLPGAVESQWSRTWFDLTALCLLPTILCEDLALIPRISR